MKDLSRDALFSRTSFLAFDQGELTRGSVRSRHGRSNVGSKFQDKDRIVAREVKRGDQVLVLRNAQGIPDWSGWPLTSAGPNR